MTPDERFTLVRIAMALESIAESLAKLASPDILAKLENPLIVFGTPLD